jgi:hypothetical protein
MISVMPTPAGASARRLSAWRIVTWVVMLLAAFGLITNLRAVLLVSNALARLVAPEDLEHARIAMAWAVGYVFVALGVVVVCFATIRRREWARGTMRVIAAGLALWAAWTAWQLFDQWQAVLSAHPGDSARIRNILLVSGAMKLISIPVLAWLAWCLGRPGVRAQFSAKG